MAVLHLQPQPASATSVPSAAAAAPCSEPVGAASALPNMSKRKTADDHDPDGADSAKKPRTEGVAAAQAHPPDGTGSIEAVRSRPDLDMRIALQTLKLVDAITATDGSWTQRMQAVADLLRADADRFDSLIDLSLIVEGDEVRFSARIRTGGTSAAGGLHPPLTSPALACVCVCAAMLWSSRV